MLGSGTGTMGTVTAGTGVGAGTGGSLVGLQREVIDRFTHGTTYMLSVVVLAVLFSNFFTDSLFSLTSSLFCCFGDSGCFSVGATLVGCSHLLTRSRTGGDGGATSPSCVAGGAAAVEAPHPDEDT